MAGMANDLCELLTEFEFIEHKVFASRPQPLIEDYDLALQPLADNIGWVRSIAVTLDGQYAIGAVANQFIIKIWDLENKTALPYLKGHSGSIQVVAIAPNTSLG
ncbi:hypothetical protein NUACC21_45800 [Scytonema sp. NUACC21]